jgi:hypothetical protein
VFGAMTVDKLRAQLAEVGARRTAAVEEKRAASAALEELIPRAIEAGIGPAEIVRLTGVSKQGVQNFRHRAEPGAGAR